jgi:hypothetical protein
MKHIKSKHLIIMFSLVVFAIGIYFGKSYFLNQPAGNVSLNKNDQVNHNKNKSQIPIKGKGDKSTNIENSLPKLDKKSKVYILKFAVKIDILEKAKLTNVPESDFLDLLRSGLNDFPTKSDIQKLSNSDVHTIPVPLSLAGEYLGHLTRHLKDNPRFLDVTLIFYDECAKKTNLLLSVKALCLANFFKLSKLHNRPIDSTRYDKKVIQLAKYAEMTN